MLAKHCRVCFFVTLRRESVLLLSVECDFCYSPSSVFFVTLHRVCIFCSSSSSVCVCFFFLSVECGSFVTAVALVMSRLVSRLGFCRRRQLSRRRPNSTPMLFHCRSSFGPSLFRCCSSCGSMSFRFCFSFVPMLFQRCCSFVPLLIPCCSSCVPVVYRCCFDIVRIGPMLFRCCSIVVPVCMNAAANKSKESSGCGT